MNILDQIALSTLLSCASLLLALKFNYFSFSYSAQNSYKMSLLYVVYAFLIFLFTSIIFVPGLIAIFYFFISGHIPIEELRESKFFGNWVSLGASLLCFIFLNVYTLNLPMQVRNKIFGLNFLKKENFFQDIAIGMISWFIAIPLIFTLDSFLEKFINYYSNAAPQEQVAVAYVKNAAQDPLLLVLSIFSIIFLVPFVEELLFRGFFQTWVKQYLGPLYAIFISSFIFAVFHLTSTQGMTNISVFGVLFVFSLFLGFVFERQQSLLAPITLHFTFNLISILRILHEL